MRRKIYQDLLLWKEKRSQKEALLIDGARRVGKSWIVEEFAKNEYVSYILIDFTNTTPAIRSLFTDYAGQPDSFFMHLMLETGVKLHERKSTTRYTLTSLERFARKYAAAIAEPIVFHTADVKTEDGIVYLPLYMVGLL